MKKQELIERIKHLDESYLKTEFVLKLIEQLDEPHKVTIPPVVSDWIEHFKKCSGTLYGSTAPYSYYGRAITDDFEGDVTETLRWIRNNSETYARAWLDGYEIQETRYVVTDGNHLYFKGYQEDVDIVILVDEQPGTMDFVKKFDSKEEAQKVADILGWKVQEVE